MSIRRVRVFTLTVLTGLWLLAHPVAAAAQAERGGFTVLIDAGVGIQSDGFVDESAVGLAGLNVGAGAFVSESLAALFRFSGTRVTYDFGLLGDVHQLSGVAGPAVQYWPSDRFNVVGGVGVGFWRSAGDEDAAVGLILGGAVTLFNRGKHTLQLGLEFAPAFTGQGPIRNFGITLGYQFL